MDQAMFLTQDRLAMIRRQSVRGLMSAIARWCRRVAGLCLPGRWVRRAIHALHRQAEAATNLRPVEHGFDRLIVERRIRIDGRSASYDGLPPVQ